MLTQQPKDPERNRFRCWGHWFQRTGEKIDLKPLLTGTWLSKEDDPYISDQGKTHAVHGVEAGAKYHE